MATRDYQIHLCTLNIFPSDAGLDDIQKGKNKVRITLYCDNHAIVHNYIEVEWDGTYHSPEIIVSNEEVGEREQAERVIDDKGLSVAKILGLKGGKMRNTYEKIDQKEFIARMEASFPGVYLTLISVIQGVALGLLVQNTFDNGALAIARIPYALISFGTIIAVFYEYSWFVGIYRWSPRISDTTIPLLLGVSEIIPLFYFAKPESWWISNFIFCAIASIAFLNTCIRCKNDMFCVKEDYERTKHGIYLQIVLTSIMSIIALISSQYHQNSKIIFGWNLKFEYIFFAIYIAGIVILILKDRRYIKKLHRSFGLNY